MDIKMAKKFKLPLARESFDECDVYCTCDTSVVDADGVLFCKTGDESVADYICETMNDIWQGHENIEFEPPLSYRQA